MTTTPPTIQQNLTPVREPELQDLLNLREKNLKINFNCVHIGTIQNFNSSVQTVTATINYKRTFFTYDEATNQYIPSYTNYPTLTDVPVFFAGAGRIRFTGAPSKGDECILLFNDRAIDNWFSSGQSNSPVSSSRTHSMSDGLALVGVFSKPHVLKNFDTAHVGIKDDTGGGQVAINIATSLIKIANNTTTLNTILQNLISALASASTVSGGPFTPGTIAAIEAVGTELAGLLE